MAAIGFIGLGNMGGPMATNLVKSGVTSWVSTSCRRHARLPRKTAYRSSPTLKGTVDDADVVITMLPGGEHVLSVWNEIVPLARQGTLFIDCSTIDVASARKAHAWPLRAASPHSMRLSRAASAARKRQHLR